MPVARVRWCPLLLVGLLVACQNDPAKPEYWVKEIQSAKRPQDKVRVLDDLRKSPNLTPAFLPMLHEQLAGLKAPEARAAIARILGELKDPSSVQPLIDAVDTGGSGSATDRMNREIAGALGQLGDARAVQVLLRLLNARDPFLELQAAESLGQLKARAAVGPLMGIAHDETKEALVANRAITAVGEIGDTSVIPDLIQLMFEQRGPTSLYESAGFALYRMGKPAADALLPVLAGRDEKLQGWARRHDVAPAALYSKSAQLLGYLLESRAEPLLLSRLAFRAEDATQQSYVRLTSADSLGRLRAGPAVKPLLTLVPTEEEVLVRASYLHALGRVGSKEAVAGLLPLADKGLWEQREPVLETLGILGDSQQIGAMENWMQGEGARVKAECAESQDKGLCRSLPELTQRRTDVYKQRVAQLKAGEKCGEKLDCWAQALEDTHPGVRIRAALTLGRSGQAGQVTPLLQHMGDPDRDARLAAIVAADWLTQNAAAARTARASVPAMETQLTQDEGKSDWVETSENLKRLVAKLKRAN